MGRKKKFIDKKNSAIFHLLAQDSSSSSAGQPAADRVLVRVDNNPYTFSALDDEVDHCLEADDPDSVFADAPGDTDEARGPAAQWFAATRKPAAGPLPDDVRREILELGLPDDGYNYLLHLREIKNAGGGAVYYQNSKAKLDQVPLDVKAYDASRVQIGAEAKEDDESEGFLYAVASKTKGVKVQKAVDPDVARLLDDSDLSRFGSDIEDLEEDFVLKANLPEEAEDKEVNEGEEEEEEEEEEQVRDDEESDVEGDVELVKTTEEGGSVGPEKLRVRRLLDEQFDLLTKREYDSDSDNDRIQNIDTEGELLCSKLKDAFKEFALDDLQFRDKYKDSGDTTGDHQESIRRAELVASKEVMLRCAEYAERYLNESEEDVDVVFVEESSDESEALDCETIVSTYSNLDNHPGKIQAPENPRKRLPKSFPAVANVAGNMIALRGKEKFPVDYLPHKTRAAGKAKTEVCSAAGKPKPRPRGEESKEEKKERKAAVKEERRLARRAKKELRGLYKGEAHRAQSVAASSGPSSIHLA